MLVDMAGQQATIDKLGDVVADSARRQFKKYMEREHG
jgi:hypothetical protein